ncbi:hypothetical protein [Brevundimonas sp.]|uniref:hypothetical protein n=1 Tax=Brevundimonas sp. TaxID=1871086 RepID=UPI0025BBCF38|nr:hypothetical protein [Brevundimonas sp.]
MMFLGKRRWGIRILEESELSVKSREGDAVLRVLLHQSKSPSNPGKGDKGKVVTGAIGMVSNFQALDDLRELGLSVDEAMTSLAKLGNGVDKVLDAHIAQRRAA